MNSTKPKSEWKSDANAINLNIWHIGSMRGDSMAPTIRDGDDLVVMDPSDPEATARLESGPVVYAELAPARDAPTKKNGSDLRRFARLTDPAGVSLIARYRPRHDGLVMLSPDNPLFAPIIVDRAALSVVTPVVEARRRIA